MDTTASDKILGMIRGLLAKAENEACTREEAEAYTAKAAALLAKYGVDRAMLGASDPTSDVVGDRMVPVMAPYLLDKAILLATIAQALRCRTVRKSGNRGCAEIHMFGFGSDLERVELLYTSLLVQASYGLAQAEPLPHETTTAFRKSWLAGFSSAIGERLREAETRAASDYEATRTGDGPSTAVVLASRDAQVNSALSKVYPRLRSGGSRRLSGSGYGSGRAAGQRADLGGARVGSAHSGRALGR